MKKEENFLFASVTKLHGYKGSVVAKIVQPLPEKTVKKLESVFLEIKGQLVPFFIEQLSYKNSEWIYINFVGIDSEPKAQALLKATIWLPSDLIPKSRGKNFQRDEILSYDVYDASFGLIGKVSRIIEMPHYPLLEILHGSKEVLIPAADEIVTKIDRKKKIIYITAPEGLIDMYLQ